MCLCNVCDEHGMPECCCFLIVVVGLKNVGTEKKNKINNLIIKTNCKMQKKRWISWLFFGDFAENNEKNNANDIPLILFRHLGYW